MEVEDISGAGVMAMDPSQEPLEDFDGERVCHGNGKWHGRDVSRVSGRGHRLERAEINLLLTAAQSTRPTSPSTFSFPSKVSTAKEDEEGRFVLVKKHHDNHDTNTSVGLEGTVRFGGNEPAYSLTIRGGVDTPDGTSAEVSGTVNSDGEKSLSFSIDHDSNNNNDPVADRDARD
jgi:hypothetical protein